MVLHGQLTARIDQKTAVEIFDLSRASRIPFQANIIGAQYHPDFVSQNEVGNGIISHAIEPVQ